MISVFGSNVGQEELDEIKTSIDNQWIGIGPKTELFEKQFSKHIGSKDFLLLDSGSNALYLAVKLLNLPKHSEVILPSFTWISCATAIILNDCIPVFCDVDLETQNITAEHIMPRLTKKTKAIMVVHYAGLPVDVPDIKNFGLPIIEDAAHAVDSKIGDKYCGTMADVGIYSFDGVKNLAIGEAGGLTAQDPELVERGRKLRYCGIEKSGFQAAGKKDRWWEYNVVDHMFKMIPDDISASIGIAQLKKLSSLQNRRRHIWNMYQERLHHGRVGWITNPQESNPYDQHSYFTYFIKLYSQNPSKPNVRDELAKYLYRNNIYTTLRYQPLHMIPIYNATEQYLPNCEILNQSGLNIPLHPNLSDDDVEKVANTIIQFGRSLGL